VHICDINEDALRAVAKADPSITSTVCDVSDRSAVQTKNRGEMPLRSEAPEILAR